MARFAGSLDANVVLRLLLNDVPEQHVAAQKLFETNKDQFVIADVAVIEVVFVLERYYKFTRTQTREAIEGLMSLVGVTCNRELLTKALPIFVQHPSLSFEDCCLAVYAELNGSLPLWTFDKKLASQVAQASTVPSKS